MKVTDREKGQQKRFEKIIWAADDESLFTFEWSKEKEEPAMSSTVYKYYKERYGK